ncbi:hypothetical protein BWI93_22525 [Siphonobacter sp. BAB-5385]|uniref:hypothetical protein n=1 Tax=Siphonobacter sp. BAB-5385 TaxID=1864822 RepID=UPI000B9E86C3|nr:hypothetical protein [Siphonobacter sp. BAB-5385]OZI06057.1 hypothetical protein BWI93_22525 [Siphonobacter sp. BAB-5385]
MNYFFITLALLASTVARAQYQPLGAITQPVEGFVITTQGDTLVGEVRIVSLTNASPASVTVQIPDHEKQKFRSVELRVIAQQIPDFAYRTGSIPREREYVLFERVTNPRTDKSVLLERLTPTDGPLALYFDPSGWKNSPGFTFGNFTISRQQELSYILVKNNHAFFLARPTDVEQIHQKVMSDCPAFLERYPTATRRDWQELGERVVFYNQSCP